MLRSANLCFVIAICLTIATTNGSSSHSVDTKIRDDPDLSQFYQLVELDYLANHTLMFSHVTVFAPTNLAFQKYKGKTTKLVLYHMSNQPMKLEEFPSSISSELEGHPPLWVTKRRATNGQEDVYINNAKILKGYSNYESTVRTPSHETKIQVLHKISEVLEPILSTSTSTPIYNPDALQFLTQSDNLILGDHRIRAFRQRVLINNKQSVYSTAEHCTFFIPVDEGFKPTTRANKIDRQVIDGHVIPNEVLFTSPTPTNTPYKTLAFTDNLKVTISISVENSDKTTKYYVKSETLSGDDNHPASNVLAEIVKANIPVRNGVVHLIQSPLMVVDTTVQQFIQSWKDKEDGPLFKFYEVIQNQGETFMRTAMQYTNVTLFAPKNSAWNEEGVQMILQDKNRVQEILNLHFVREPLPIDVIQNRAMTKVHTAANRENLYFNVISGPSGNKTVTVEGGGVNATVVMPNLGATNGIIHIIDRVLGVPYRTIKEKLKTDPTLHLTYTLGKGNNFNNLLDNTRKRYTYFAPRDTAWQKTDTKYPSLSKKLFMQDFSYHARQVLERHLVDSDQPLTMAKMLQMYHKNHSQLHLNTLRDTLKLNIREAGDGYQIQWQGVWVRVIRPDVACTNGIIHVIDDVLMRESDIYVTGSAATMAAFIPHIVTILAVKWLL